MFRSPSRTSAKMGVAPAWTITFAVAGQVIGVVITSSPGPIPSASSARCIAAVPEATAITYSASRNSLSRRSSSAVFGPVVNHPERSVSATAAISSSPIAGGWKPSNSVLGKCFCVDIDRVEAYEVGRGLRSLQRLLRRVAHRENRPRSVGAAAQRLEHVTRSAIDANADDAG